MSGSAERYCYRTDSGYDAGKNLGCPNEMQGQCTAGNPINIGTGNKYQVEVDYPGAGPNPLQFRRYYNSLAGRSTATNGVHRFGNANSPTPIVAFMDPDQTGGIKAMATDSIGVNWRHTYQRGVVESSTPALRSASLYREDGRVVVFNEYNGNWLADADVNYTLIELTSGGATVGWTVKTPSDTTETYNAVGQLTTIADRPGNTITVHYDTAGRVDYVVDQFGRELHFDYATDPQTGVEWWEDPTLVNQIRSVTDPLGNEYSYDYNPDGTLRTVTYPDTTVREYKYENSSYPFALTAIIDGNSNQFATFGYDSDGRANLSFHGQGAEVAERIDVGYTKTSGFAPYFSIASSQVTYGIGAPESYVNSTSFSRRLGVAKMNGLTQGSEAESREYWPDGNVKRFTNLAGSMAYREYNSRNLEVLRTEAEGAPEERTITTTWDPTYRLPNVITEPMRTVDFEYFSNGDLNTITITSLNVSGSEDLSTDGNRTRIWTYNNYNGHGQVGTIDGPRIDVSDVTTFDYYDEPTCPSGNGECGQLKSIVDAEGNQTDFDEYYADGRLKKMTDPNGLTTEFEYDARRRLTKVTVSDGISSRGTQYFYDGAGQLDLVTLPAGLALDYEWTTAHLLDFVEDNAGNRVDYAYDAHGNRVAEDFRDPAGVLRRAMASTYDSFGFIDTLTIGTSTTDYDFDAMGNLERVTDGNQNVTQYVIDALGRIDLATDALLHDTDYGYDSQSNLASVTAPNGAETVFEYDGLGNLDHEDSADRGFTDFDYDDAGNLRHRTDARNVTVEYGYDALNRVTGIDYPDDSLDVAFAYDACANGIGRLCAMTDGSGSTGYEYDTRGNVVGRTIAVGTVSGSLGYAYDAADRLVQITYPSGRTVDYTRNVLGQVTEVTTTSADGLTTEVLASDMTYAPFGPLQALTYGNGIALTRDHDLAYRLTSQVAGPVQQLSYGYDANNNVTAVTDGLDPSRSQTLGYDALDRLTGASGTYGSLGYGYDALGNRQTKSGPGGSETYGYAPDSNRLIEFTAGSTSTISYDANGNITGDGYYGFSYGDHNRMTEARVLGSVVGTYRYNGLGQRVSKDNGQVTLFVYDEAGRLIGEYDAMGVTLRETVWLDGAPLAVMASDTAYFVHADHLGTPRAITTGTGTAIWRWEPAPFGDTAPDQDPDGDGLTAVYHPRFPGQYFDTETGLHYNYYRDYIPAFGRYLESDPIGLAGGLNTYGYGYQNPLRYTDPTGEAVPIAVAACAANPVFARAQLARVYELPLVTLCVP